LFLIIPNYSYLLTHPHHVDLRDPIHNYQAAHDIYGGIEGACAIKLMHSIGFVWGQLPNDLIAHTTFQDFLRLRSFILQRHKAAQVLRLLPLLANIVDMFWLLKVIGRTDIG
jgi:hypothetical protein